LYVLDKKVTLFDKEGHAVGNISGNTQYESNNTVCTDTICKKLKMIFSVLFFALLCILGLLVSSTYSILVNCTALLCLLLFLIVGGRLADPIDRLSAKKFNALFVLLLGSAFAVSIYLAYEMRIHLPGDTDIIFASVADLLRDGKLNEANPRIDAMHYPGLGLYTNNDYFCRYPNNIGLLMLYAGVYAFGGKTGLPASTDAGHLPAIVMTSLAVAVTILLVCLCIKIVFKKNSYALFTLLLCYAFLPFVFSIPNFYTDLWVLPFTAGGVYCYLSNKFSAAPKGWRGFLAGLLLSVGVQMKITAAIGFVVIVLDLLLGRHVHRWKNLALLFLGFFLFLFAFTAWYRYSGIIDFTRSDEIGAPWNLWLLFGSHDTGGGTEIYKDMAFAAAFPTMEERSAAIWKRIFENYRSYSFSEFLELLRNKLLFAWNNSMFESSEYLLWPIDSNWTFYITQPQFLPTQLIRAYSTIYMLFLYAANILSAGVALFRKKINFTFIPNLFVFGTMLYLLIFENAPRRAMIAVPFMIYNVIFLLSQWRGKPDGAQLAERFRMRIHKN
jgi:hypothetical protein